MPVYCSFELDIGEDANITVPLTPPTPIGGWDVSFLLSRRAGGEALFAKSMASGYYGVSGMNIVNSGQGSFSVSINSVDTSGFDTGNYAYKVKRTNSGFVTDLTEGYLSLLR